MPAEASLASLRRLLAPFTRLAGRLVGRESAWDRIVMDVPVRVFGPGSQKPFTVYFEGESRVRVESLDEIVAWLQSCEYITDLDLFRERDVWQHPASFERSRRGDCEDFALWAWRKLAEIGIDAEFCVGRVNWDDGPSPHRQHAWVIFRVDGTAFLFEPAARTSSRIIRPFEEAMAEYVPHFSVNHRFETHAFVGCVSDSHVSRPDPTLPLPAVQRKSPRTS